MSTASEARVMSLNCGSSSIKFAMYEQGETLRRKLSGSLNRIGLRGANLTLIDSGGLTHTTAAPSGMDHEAAASYVLTFLEKQQLLHPVVAVGHRVVHGMHHAAPAVVTPELIQELRSLSPYAPDHLPGEIACMEIFRQLYPELPQIACFDTAFHSQMPKIAQWLPLPRRYHAQGVQRFGFHGLSYTYLMEELSGVAKGSDRVILAHLGNGASLCAVHDGRSIDTSMGLTPASGLVMSTRSGDLDPCLFPYLSRTEGISMGRFLHMVNHESGLLGISETTSDMRDLLAIESTDTRAADAISLFCYQAKKWIGSFAAVLGGLDRLVFTGGVGENCPSVRSRICEGLSFLGIELSYTRNMANDPLISTHEARVDTHVIRSDEELIIARSVCRLLELKGVGFHPIGKSKVVLQDGP